MNSYFTEGTFPVDVSGNRNINPEMMRYYLSQLPIKARRIAQLILDNMQYVTFNELYNELLVCFKKFSHNIDDKPFHILFEKRKIGSSQWLVNMLKSHIKELNFQGFITTDYKGDDVRDILIIDDFSCTGSQIINNTLEEFISHHLYVDYEKGTLDTFKNISFHTIIPYMSDKAINAIDSALSHYNDEEFQDEIIDYSLYTGDKRISCNLSGNIICPLLVGHLLILALRTTTHA